MADLENPVIQESASSSIENRENHQDMNINPEDFLSQFDPESEFYKQAVQEYQELIEKKNEYQSSQIIQSKIALHDMMNEFQSDMRSIHKLTAYNSILPAETIFSILDANQEMEEQFFTILDLVPEDTILAYIEAKRLNNPRRLNETGISRMINYFHKELIGGLIADLQQSIELIKTEQDRQHLEKRILNLPENIKEIADKELDEISIAVREKMVEEYTEGSKKEKEIFKEKKAGTEKIKQDFNKDILEKEKGNNELKEHMYNLKNAFKNLNVQEYTGPIHGEIVQAIDNFVGIDFTTSTPEEIVQAVNALKDVLLSGENSELFKELLREISTKDIQKYSEIYDALKTVGGFDNFLQNLPKPESLSNGKNDVINITSTDELLLNHVLSSDKERYGNIVTDGDRVVDMDVYPPKHYLVSKTGFRIDATVAYGSEIQDARKEYMEQQTLIYDEYARLDQEYILINDTIQELQTEIQNKKQNGESPIDLEKKLAIQEHILNQTVEKMNELQQDSEILETRFNNHLYRLMDDYSQRLKEKEEKVREVRDFVSRIGLDLLPQSTIELIFNELKRGSLIVNGMGNFDPKKIDLANGNFGESVNESQGTKWQENLVKLFNKMISGYTGEPLNFKNYIGEMKGTVDPTYFKEDLEKAGVINDLGEPLLTQIRKNISQSNILEDANEETEQTEDDTE